MEELIPTWETEFWLLFFNQIVAILFAIVGGFIAWKKGGECVIVITATLGSVLVVRGIALMIGGYPSEKRLAQMAEAKGITFHWTFWVFYLPLLIAALCFSIWFQWNKVDPHEQIKRFYP